MPPLKSDVWTWDTLIHILIIIALAIVARWLLRKGVDWTIRLMVSRSEKREATMPLSLIHISEPTRLHKVSRMPSSA